LIGHRKPTFERDVRVALGLEHIGNLGRWMACYRRDAVLDAAGPTGSDDSQAV
jgi:hypothetical protein